MLCILYVRNGERYGGLPSGHQATKLSVLKTGLAGIQLRPKLWNWYALLIPCRSALQRRCQLLLLILVDVIPAGGLRQPFEGLSVGGNPPARDLGDIRRLQVDLQREAVHEAGIVESAFG
jgi:hypothetical protein